MHNLFDLTGKKALVTGGSKGIGNRLARGLHDAGAEVVIFYNSTYSEQMAQEMQGDGPAVYAIQCNVADRSSLDTAVAQAAEKLGGRIDILINAAGINRRYWLEDFPLDMWDEVIATNLNGTVYCSQLVGQYMLRQGYGRIVNAIAPGYIETDQTLPLQQDPKRYQEILDRIAVGRWGKPDDLVGPVLMLCSEAGSYCNGLVMPVDGGYLAR